VGKGGAASTAEFVAAWRYIYQLQKKVGGANVQMLWCMSTSDAYQRLSTMAPGRPIWLSEVGCRQTTAADATSGRDKVE
jgi:hypothetical protein